MLPTALDLVDRVRDHRPRVTTDPWAATALILGEADRGPEILFIKRVDRAGDRWSGHMALPGGKRDAEDPSLEATAVREAFEEVAIPLDEPIARLDDQLGRLPAQAVASFVFRVDGRPEPLPEPLEVAEAVWIPIADLLSDEAQGRYRFKWVMPFPAFVLNGYTIWGLTHRIVTHFFEITGLRGR